MQSFSKKEILQYFEDLNQMLASHNQTGELLICGGASMALLYDETIRTQDIDGYILSESVKQDILNYAAVIQEEYGLSSNWFNESAKGFINRNWPQDTIETYSNLTVKSVPAEQLLAMKLSSARPYSRDQEDAIRLMDYLGIQTQEEVFQILENNLQEPVLLPKVQYFAQETFQQYITKSAPRKEGGVSFPGEPIREQTGGMMKNKPQIEIHLNWMKSNEQEPSKETLRTLYGAEDGKESDAAEIKDYALKGCSNLQEAIRVIIHYAEDLNREQQRYRYRSSYEDRSQSVSSVDEIAFQHMEELAPFCDPDTELTLELAKELQTEGYPLEFPQRQKKMYETIEALPEKLREQFQKVQNLKGQIAQVEWERSDFSQYYLKPIEDQFAELQKEEQQIKKRSPLSKWWNRGKLECLEQERKQLELAKAPLLETINAMNKSIEVTQKTLSKTAYELEHFFYPWEDGNLDTIHPIRTEAELEQTIQEIRRYGEQPEIQEAYRAAVRLLDAVQRPEFPSFAEERERRKQTSFPEKENRQGISSELERDGEAFTQLR